VAAQHDRVRLAELVATLSLGTDLGLGQPMEHVIRQTLIALRMGDRLGLSAEERTVVYYAGLLAWVGCHTDAYEQAKWFGDDIWLKADHFRAPDPSPGWVVRNFGAGRPLLERVRLGAAFLAGGVRDLLTMLENHWLAADELARRLGLGPDVRRTLQASYERWDGEGPGGLKGQAIRLSSRLVYLADVATWSRSSTAPGASALPSRSRRSAAAPTSTRPWWTCSAARRRRCSVAWTRAPTGTG
jgi:HD domain